MSIPDRGHGIGRLMLRGSAKDGRTATAGGRLKCWRKSRVIASRALSPRRSSSAASRVATMWASNIWLP